MIDYSVVTGAPFSGETQSLMARMQNNTDPSFLLSNLNS